MSLFAYLNGTDRAYSVRLNDFGLSSRADGSVGMGGIVFDDADATLTIRGWMSVVVKETACTAAPVLFSGYVFNRTYTRSSGDRTYRTGAARFVDCNLMDQNAVLGVRLITGADGKRPAETHNARITWLLASAYMSGLIGTTTLVDTSDPRPFEEADYRGQYPHDVLNDLGGPIFRIFFVHLVQTAGTFGLFFDTPGATTNTSTLTISNVYTDVNNTTCFAPFVDATLERDPSEVYAKIRYTYAHGTVIENDTGTRDEFFLDNGLGYRGLQVDNSRIGLESSARSMAQNLLGRDDSENDTVTVTVQLPASKVGLIEAGQRIGVRFSHLPGYETQVFTRVTGRTITQAPDNNEVYNVTLELNTHGLSSTGGGGAPSPGDFPHSSSPPSIVQQVSGATSLTMPSAITAGDTLVFVGNARSGVSWNYAADGYTLVQSQAMSGGSNTTFSVYKLAGAGESQTLNMVTDNHSGTWYELPGTWTPDTMDTSVGAGSPAFSGPITVASGSIVFAASAYGQGGAYDSGAATFTTTPAAGWTEDYDAATPTGGGPTSWTAHRFDSGSITGSSSNSAAGGAADGFGVGTTNWAAQVVAFVGDASNDPPAPGQTVPWTVVTMAGAVGTTAFPYADGSLLVKVDGVLISPASYTETDPAAGTFTLDWIPATDEVVTVQYMGR